MSTVRSLLPALGAGMAFTLGGGGEKVAFQPSAGSTVSKTFTIGGDFALDELSMIVNGQDIGGMIGELSMSLKQETRYEITDTYKAVADGRPTELLRTFDALSSRMTMDVSPAPEEIPEFESASALEGKTVAFRWDDEKHEYARSFTEEGGDQALLEKLEEDMDLRVFLPEGETSENESWSVDLVKLESVVMPGGNLSLLPTNEEFDAEGAKIFEEIFDGFGEKLGDLLDGECNCTYKGAREEDGARLAEIAIELEVAATLDLSELIDKAIRAAIEENGAGEMIEFTLDSADLTMDFDGSGTLLWDLGAGRVHSFLLSGDTTFALDLSVGIEVEGEKQDMDAEVELSGSMRSELATKE